MTEKLLQVMMAAAEECGRIILDRTCMAMAVNSKTSSRDVVTQYDMAVQDVLVARLSQAFPCAGFLTEENSAQIQTTGGMVFVIDPIDGTMNFVKDLQHSCISIACLMGGKPVAGVVYNPYDGEVFWAALGKGAFLNDTPISVTSDPLSDTLVLFGTSPYNLEINQTFDMVRDIYTKCLDVRRMGSAALDLCYVACGRAGLFFEMQLSLWDYAAAVLILTEAGGTAVKLNGTSLDFSAEKSSVIAGSGMTITQSGLVREECV